MGNPLASTSISRSILLATISTNAWTHRAVSIAKATTANILIRTQTYKTNMTMLAL
jgi:hypothetical protein